MRLGRTRTVITKRFSPRAPAPRPGPAAASDCHSCGRPAPQAQPRAVEELALEPELVARPVLPVARERDARSRRNAPGSDACARSRAAPARGCARRRTARPRSGCGPPGACPSGSTCASGAARRGRSARRSSRCATSSRPVTRARYSRSISRRRSAAWSSSLRRLALRDQHQPRRVAVQAMHRMRVPAGKAARPATRPASLPGDRAPGGPRCPGGLSTTTKASPSHTTAGSTGGSAARVALRVLDTHLLAALQARALRPAARRRRTPRPSRSAPPPPRARRLPAPAPATHRAACPPPPAGTTRSRGGSHRAPARGSRTRAMRLRRRSRCRRR